MTSSPMNIRFGVLGAGGFSRFSADAFSKVPGTTISGVYDNDPKNSKSFSDTFGSKVFSTIEQLLTDPQTDIIYIATPPFLHFSQSKQALLSGKHVICEKPAAFKAEEVEELIRIAQEKNLLYVVNLMQRYNPLYPKIKSLIEEKLLGEFLHGYFENYASDEQLDLEHWMWDEKQSGGIFIEHAVHFFDLIEGWLGSGELIASQKIKRKGFNKDFWPEVQATCKYGNGLFNFYHGFHQANRMDRQELKLVFETGEVSLFEWVPSLLELKGLVSSENKKAIENIFPEGKMNIIETFKGKDKTFKSNSTQHIADHRIFLEYGDSSLKYTIYQELLTDIMNDQVQWLQNRDHQRRITEQNALNSVTMAEMANNSAILI